MRSYGLSSIIIPALLLALSACASRQTATPASLTPQEREVKQQRAERPAAESAGSVEKGAKRFVAAVGTDGVQRIDMTAGSYYFDPSVIVVKVNVPVEIRIKKEPGFTPHNFTLKAQEAGIDVSVDLGTEPKTIRFTPVKTGDYPFWCNKRFLFFRSHRDRGMHGLLEVVE